MRNFKHLRIDISLIWQYVNAHRYKFKKQTDKVCLKTGINYT